MTRAPVLACVGFATFAGCGRPEPVEDPVPRVVVVGELRGNPVLRLYDPEYGVVCYAARPTSGISCVQVAAPPVARP